MKNKFYLLLLQVLLPCFIFAQNYSFTQMASCPEIIYAPSSFTIGDSIFVVGGVIGNACCAPKYMTQHVWLYSTTNNTWNRVGDFPGLAVYGASSFVINGKGYLCNGWDSLENGTGPNNLWQYDPTTDTWANKAPFPGPTRYTACAFSVNNKGYVGLGFKPLMNDFWEYDPATDSWSQKANFPGVIRQAPVNFAIGNYGYVGMGAVGDGMGGFYYQSDFYKYDPTSDSWTQLGVFPGDPVANNFTFNVGGNAYVVNGSDYNSYNYSVQGESNNVWKYDAGSDTWTLWGLFPDTGSAGGAMGTGQGGSAGFMGLGALNSVTSFEGTAKFWRFGPGNGNTCQATVLALQVNNATRNFQAQGGFSSTAQILWNFGDGTTGSGTSVNHSYTAAGVYYITLTVADSTNSCSSTAYDTVTVGSISQCSLSLTYTNINSLYTLVPVVTGVGPYTYIWSDGENVPDPLINIPSGDSAYYCLTIIDSTGCQASACEFIIGGPDTTVSCQTYLYIYPDPYVPGLYYGNVYHTGSSGPATYTWNFGNGVLDSIPGDSMPNFTYSNFGFYDICLTITDSDGCVSSFCDSVFYAYKVGGGPMNHFQVVPKSGPTNVKNVGGQLQLSVYPNPTNDELAVVTSAKIDRLTIYSALGQVVGREEAPLNNIVHVQSLSAGIYFIDVQTGNASSRVKFVKTNP